MCFAKYIMARAIEPRPYREQVNRSKQTGRKWVYRLRHISSFDSKQEYSRYICT